MGRIDVSQLQFELQTAQAEFNKWAGDLTESLDTLEQGHRQALQDGGEEIAQMSKEKTELEAESERLNAKLDADRSQFEAATAALKAAREEEGRLPELLQELRIEEETLSKALQRQEEASRQSATKNEGKLTVLRDAVGQYHRHLGMEFRPQDDGRLQVVLTQVDHGQPGRAFSFHVLILEDGKYQVSSYQPELPAAAALEAELNATLDFSKFVRCVRREFRQLCA
eukprot:jgi/Tetstr1/442389/TSEL_030515.t1